MQHPALAKVLEKYKRTDHPNFRIGDTIKVFVRIKEGDKERTQLFEGVLIARKNTGMGENIVVRKMTFGTGVERIFPIHAPVVDRIEIVRTGQVRKSKLYYLRALKGKAARLKERRK
ncbi:50S ribosomal protein L19 [Bryobacter aggregatus]|uniref:50S ribosomal protein L19 n=1 Tax=Bryobacter aggregatus TaxID=360054 RepID=UPI0004E2812E|nr:50S ribosomal protein L19 [Bryobacter aggregatus]